MRPQRDPVAPPKPDGMALDPRVRVELVYDATCPNVEDARRAIRAALLECGMPVTWKEWERGLETTPPALRALGSPTILINGRDVGSVGGEASEPQANSCRVYVSESGRLSGAPTARQIVDILRSLS